MVLHSPPWWRPAVGALIATEPSRDARLGSNDAMAPVRARPAIGWGVWHRVPPAPRPRPSRRHQSQCRIIGSWSRRRLHMTDHLCLLWPPQRTTPSRSPCFAELHVRLSPRLITTPCCPRISAAPASPAGTQARHPAEPPRPRSAAAADWCARSRSASVLSPHAGACVRRARACP